MKIKSELRKMKVNSDFIAWVIKAKLTWEEKIALRDAVRKIASKDGVKKLLEKERHVEVEFDECPLGMVMSGCCGLTHNILIKDTSGVEHEWYRTIQMFEDDIEYKTVLWTGYMSHNFKQFHDNHAKIKASLRTRYQELYEKGEVGFERRPLNF